MAVQKAPAGKTNKRGARSSERGERRGGEQVALLVIMWLVPVALFAYVSLTVALATGMVPDYLMTFDFKRAAILVAIVFLMIAALLILVPVVSPKKAHRAGPWDPKTTPGQLPGN